MYRALGSMRDTIRDLDTQIPNVFVGAFFFHIELFSRRGRKINNIERECMKDFRERLVGGGTFENAENGAGIKAGYRRVPSAPAPK